jgi:hypothetical protein
VADICYINPAGCDIRRDKNPDPSSFKSIESTEALGQTSVSVDDRDTVTRLFKRLTESIDPILCPSEYKNGPSFSPQQRHQQFRLLLGGRMMQRLGHTFSRCRGRRHHHMNGTVQTRLNQACDVHLNRGGKEQRLSLHRQRVKNLIDLWSKSHIEHTVSFIEHQDFNRGQIDRPVPHVVQQTPRCGNQDIGPLAQSSDLSLHITPSDDDRGREVVASTKLLN